MTTLYDKETEREGVQQKQWSNFGGCRPKLHLAANLPASLLPETEVYSRPRRTNLQCLDTIG